MNMKRFIARIAIFVLVFGVFGVPAARAGEFTTASDTMTRLKISTNSDHTVVFTLSGTDTFDQSTTTDTIRVDFPHSSAFTQSGTWVTGDFTFNDGTARTVNAVAQGPGTIDVSCTDGTNNVGVAIDTTNHIFTVKPCGASFVASGATATITFAILGAGTDGLLTNPSLAGNYFINLAMCDETASCTTSFTTTDSKTVAVGIADDDQVSLTATVDPTITLDIDTATTDTGSNAPYVVAFGTITTTDSRVSGPTDNVNFVWLDLATNGTGGLTVTIKNKNGANGLVSDSVSADEIDSTDGAIADGTERYGFCVANVTQTGGTLQKAAPYNTGTCADDSETNDVQGLTTAGETIVNSNGDTLTGGRARIVANASISGLTEAHADYNDTVTFLATATF
jgi:hypothetical protein